MSKSKQKQYKQVLKDLKPSQREIISAYVKDLEQQVASKDQEVQDVIQSTSWLPRVIHSYGERPASIETMRE